MNDTTGNKNRISTIVRACRLIGRMCKSNPEVPESHILYYRMLENYYSRILRAQEEKGLIAAHTIFFPVEILYAMNITPMHTELTAWMTALFSGNSAELLDKSSEAGLAAEICSPYRILAGALAVDFLPRPDMTLWTNLICDNAGKGGDLIMHMTGCKGFFVDCPFKKTDVEDNYLKEELRDIIAFLEKQSGCNIDWNKLGENIVRLDRQIELFREINNLRKKIPSPFPPQDFLKLFTVDCLFAGQPEATEYLDKVRQELIEKSDGESRTPEKFRIMNIMMPPVLQVGVIEKISLECGAVSVADPLFCSWQEGHLDHDKPLDSILAKIRMNPVMQMYGPLDEKLLNMIKDCASEYRVDGAIYYAHIGCRQSASLIKLIKDALNEMGIPVLILDCDIIDITITPEEELQKKLRQFFELLEDR